LAEIFQSPGGEHDAGSRLTPSSRASEGSALVMA